MQANRKGILEGYDPGRAGNRLIRNGRETNASAVSGGNARLFVFAFSFPAVSRYYLQEGYRKTVPFFICLNVISKEITLC